MSFYIPFNHNPASRDIKTAAYTIPAGQYAFVHFLAYDTDCTIGSDVVIPALSVSDVQTLSASNTNIYSPTSGYDFEGYISIFETLPSSIPQYRLTLRSSAADYGLAYITFGSSTTSSFINILDLADSGQTGLNATDKSVGFMPIYVPSGDSIHFKLISGSCSTLVHVYGGLKSKIGASDWFHVPSGVEVDGSKFEVTLFNLV